MIDDVVEGFEDSVRQPVLTYALPGVFLSLRTAAIGASGRRYNPRQIYDGQFTSLQLPNVRMVSTNWNYASNPIFGCKTDLDKVIFAEL